MANYVHGSSLSYQDYLQGRSFVADITGASREAGRRVAMEFIRIPAGTFQMGEAKTTHKVTLTQDYLLGRFPVTQAQWKSVMGDNPSSFKGADHPVEGVSWEDAQKFIAKLNAMAGEKHYRLPTEAEWEYACRAGSQSKYCFGDDESRLGDYAWYDANSGKATHPVGQKKSNAWGLHDMHGNVWEWCWDWYDRDYYGNSPTDNPVGLESGSDRVLRGGSWSGHAGRCRAAGRDGLEPSLRYCIIGFRLVLLPVQPR